MIGTRNDDTAVVALRAGDSSTLDVTVKAQVLEGIADQEFAAAASRPRYVADGVERLQEFLHRYPQYANVALTKIDLDVRTERAEDATEAQWSMLSELST